MPGAEQREHDQAQRGEHGARHDRIRDHERDGPPERFGQVAGDEQHDRERRDPRADAAQREHQHLARAGIRIQPDGGARARGEPVLQSGQHGRARAPAGQQREEIEQDRAGRLRSVPARQRIQLVARRVEAAGPIVQRRIGLAQVRLDGRHAGRDRAPQAGVRPGRCGRCGGRRLRGLRDVAQRLELRDERVALPVIVEDTDDRVERLRDFGGARRRRCRGRRGAGRGDARSGRCRAVGGGRDQFLESGEAGRGHRERRLREREGECCGAQSQMGPDLPPRHGKAGPPGGTASRHGPAQKMQDKRKEHAVLSGETRTP
ncbi:protein of unknown function [Burkholderia multivorans]